MIKPKNAKTPQEYIQKISDPDRKKDIQTLHNLILKTVPKLKPHMESNGSIIGYGSYHYEYDSGREGDWMIIGLASQKNYISVYACASDGNEYVAEKYKKKLPKANIGKSCIRFKKLEDIDKKALVKILKEAAKLQEPHMNS